MDRGFDNLLWFMGVVEDNNDPQMLGRVRVRAFGIHPSDLEKVPTEDLPWAYIVSGTYQSNYKPPELNQWAFGFFLDGKSAQQPVLLGTLLGMPTVTPAAYGDSSGGFTAMGDGGSLDGLFQPDLSRLARGEDLQNSSVMVRNSTGGQTVRSSDGRNWSTPKSGYAAEYPHNYVHESRSGHVFEMDDTPGAERVNLYHRSGSHVEMDKNGNLSLKSTGSGFVVIDKNCYVRINGDANVTVEGRANVLVENDCTMQVDGTMTQKVFGDYVLEVSGRADFNIGEAIRMRGAKIAMESATENIDIMSAADLNLQAKKGVNIKGAGNIQMTSDGDIHFNSDDAKAKEASPTDLKQPEQRKTVAYRAYADGLDYGASSDDSGNGDEPTDTGTDDQGTPNADPAQPTGDADFDADRQQYGPMLDAIAQSEGNDAGRGYNETFGYGAYTGGPVNLENMTLAEVEAVQTTILNNPNNKYNDSAVGRYSINRLTLRDVAPRLGMDWNTTIFNKETQDRLAIAILKSTRGKPSVLRGRWTALRNFDNNTLTDLYFGNR